MGLLPGTGDSTGDNQVTSGDIPRVLSKNNSHFFGSLIYFLYFGCQKMMKHDEVKLNGVFMRG